MTYWVSGTGELYSGDMVPGDRAATQAEIDAWFAPSLIAAQKALLTQQIADIDSATIPLLNQAVIAQITSGAPIPPAVATQLQNLATQKAALEAQLAAL